MVFPYGDGEFDLVFLTSIFTHMPASHVRRYLSEINRVLKPGGRCLCTAFLLNEEAEGLIAAGKSAEEMVFRIDDYFSTSLEVPERATGFSEGRFLQWCRERELTVSETYYGCWCGRSEFLSYQDILLLDKR